ncbi:MAG: phosphate ABC transporter permease PstA [Bacteroidetes bacterium]|nr:phosphate ABC transporter permease PstA [Bacteroidota bacterium]
MEFFKSIYCWYRVLKDYRRISVTNDLAINFIRIMSIVTITLLLAIVGFIAVNGIQVLSWDFIFSPPKNNFTEGGIGPAIFGTISVVLLMIFFAIPLGVFAAIYINEYIFDKWYSRIITVSIHTLAGVPSIVIGLFGFGFFVLFLGRNLDELLNTGLLFGKPAMLWASITLGILVLPLIIFTTIEALKSVPEDHRNAALGLGATKWEMISKVVLPQARPGILTGIILSISKAVSETAPVLFLGCAFFLPELPVTNLNFGAFVIPMINPSEQFMYLSYHIFALATQSTNPTVTLPLQYGTALVLILTIVLLNIFAILFRYKFTKTFEKVRGY